MAIVSMLPRELKSIETQRKILDTAEIMLAQYDFKFLTVRNICDEAHVAYGSFYHHFGTKENVLIHCGKRLFHRNLVSNPCPSEISEYDYLHCILWYGLLLAKFCETLGKEYVRTLYLNSENSDDMFAEVYEKYIFPALDLAMENGYMQKNFRQPMDEEKVLADVKKDTCIVSRGVALYWCCSMDADNMESISETMEHLLFRLISSTRSDKQIESPIGHKLLTEMNYDQKIKIISFKDCVDSRNEE